VRRTGGLADSVEPFDPKTGRGTGFLFDEFSATAFEHALLRALECWRDPVQRARLIRNGMSRDFSWERQVRHYVELYRRLAAR
jgi:starch synthase